MLLIVYLCCLYCCSLDLLSYFTVLAAKAALEVTISVLNKLDTSYDIVIRVLYVVMINVTNDIDVVFLTETIPQLL